MEGLKAENLDGSRKLDFLSKVFLDSGQTFLQSGTVLFL
jgi:hypothetical protein